MYPGTEVHFYNKIVMPSVPGLEQAHTVSTAVCTDL